MCGSGASERKLRHRKSSNTASMKSIRSRNLLDPLTVDWSAIDLESAGTTIPPTKKNKERKTNK